MATKKKKSTAKESTAKVSLDAQTVHRFESALRDGLVASGAVMAAENKKAKLTGHAKVDLDPATVARLSEVLREGLVASHARMSDDNKILNQMTGKVKTRRPKSKKAR